ncbi:hypothetical protein [uncultured Microbulbifer sp.]|uniref:hypothetical protein n=1 Tax=uncultured Microbulbifer sp. TaxID=348147 RepID=UPI002625CE75|nr:hypothetical protein [uncultured Microbulbifer sp.]
MPNHSETVPYYRVDSLLTKAFDTASLGIEHANRFRALFFAITRIPDNPKATLELAQAGMELSDIYHSCFSSEQNLLKRRQEEDK